MRGVVTGGMAAALESLGLRNVFDVVYGTSAGAINGAYLLTGQATEGSRIYFRNISNRRFISYRRLVTPRPVVSLDFLVDHVMRHEQPLAFPDVLASDIPLVAVATHVEEAVSHALRNFSDDRELATAFKASARIPVAAGPPVSFRGEHYIDGGLVESIPYHTAIRDGCTHLLVLLSRPADLPDCRPPRYESWIARPYLRRLNPQLESAYLRRPSAYIGDLHHLFEHTGNPDHSPYIHAVATPARTPTVSRLNRSTVRIERNHRDGYDAVHRLFPA